MAVVVGELVVAVKAEFVALAAVGVVVVLQGEVLASGLVLGGG